MGLFSSIGFHRHNDEDNQFLRAMRAEIWFIRLLGGILLFPTDVCDRQVTDMDACTSFHDDQYRN